MNTRLQDLTEKLYREGVSKGQEDAARTLESAKEEAGQILEDARQEAAKIVEAAEEQAKRLISNAESERKMKFDQAKSALRQELESFISGTLATEAVAPVMADKDFMSKVIADSIATWIKNENVSVFVNSEQAEALKKYFASQAKDLLDAGVELQTIHGVKAGFKIGPADGSYQVSFTEADFIAYIKSFLRPQMEELLFGTQKDA